MKIRYFLVILTLLAGLSYWVVGVKAQDKQPTLNQVATNTSQLLNVGTSSNQALITPGPAQPAPEKTTQEYIVQAGDTIGTIAQQFGISINTILWANNLSSTSLISPKDKLIILPISGVTYNVKSGDTFSKIAADFKIDATKIAEANDLTVTDALKINQLLVIPDGQKLASPITKTIAATTPTPVKKSTSKKTTTAKKTSTTVTKTTGITWTSSALSELYKVPSFVRSIVKGKINNYAAKHGIHVITKEVYKSIKV